MRAIVKFSRRQRAGFTLTEVALAMLVVAIGMISVFGLMTESLGLGKDSTDDTQMGLFAEGVFNGVRAMADNTNISWTAIDTVTIPVISPAMWNNSDANSINIRPGAGVKPIMLRPSENGITTLQDIALRYELLYAAAGDRKTVTLRMWPGGVIGPAMGPFTVVSPGTNQPTVFYTELYRHGKP